MNGRENRVLSETHRKDLRVVLRFIEHFCQKKHAGRVRAEVGLPSDLSSPHEKKAMLCHECAELFVYGMGKRLVCPLDPKPVCRKCPVHCYSAENREKIRQVMAFSGRRMVLRGRLDYLWHYFL